MLISKIIIKNFKSFEDFELDFNSNLSIIVGDNEVGKSTLLEAINLALTGKINGKNIIYELSPFLFNQNIVKEYIETLKENEKIEPPKILIELHFEDNPKLVSLKGTNNSKRANLTGVFISIEFNEDYQDEFNNYIENPEKITSLPTEYYKVNWYSFDHNAITKRSLPINTTFIDATTIKLQNGTDYYIKGIINDSLNPKERAQLSLAYRRLKEDFSEEESIKNINKKLKEEKGNISDKELTVSIDVSSKSSWEMNLTSYLDEIPFQFIGNGDQNILKILLALERKADTTDIILIEEPENHLSYTKMSNLINRISEKFGDKQIIITTHSTFVLNKLGIDKVILLNSNKETAILKDLSPDTQKYFKKLPGYDTLRLLIAEKSILVEGPSDELIVQKAYKQKYNKIPIDDGIDVISVRGLSFKRFLEIAVILKKDTKVITDNDGDYVNKVEEKYKDYINIPTIEICYDEDIDYPTLEPQIVKVNDLETLNKIFGQKITDKVNMIEYMLNYKTECALKLFETEIEFKIPEYITNAISNE